MKTKEITENNKLIAEFMGMKPSKIFGKYSISKDHCTCNEDTPDKAMNGFASIAKYNTSWDWLMPVVEKIDSLLADGEFITSEYRTCYLDIYTPSWIFPEYSADVFCITGEGKSRLEAMLNCVLEFITWYNENK